MYDHGRMAAYDPEVAAAMKDEYDRQKGKIVLIASENYVSEAVLDAMGSHLTNKYAEGYPGRRYYGGCEHVDEVESLAIERAKRLFNAEHANVQPHSGANANMAVFFAALNPGDTVLSMNLAHGGHLSHGMAKNFSGRYFNIVDYGVSEGSELLDYGAIRAKALECRPRLIVCGASAYPRAIDFKAFRDIADECGALLMADIAHIAGPVAAGLHQSPIPYAHYTTSTTHKTLRGPRGGLILCSQEHAKAIDSAVFPGLQGGPLMHLIAAKAVAFGEALSGGFADYQKKVLGNAKALAAGLSKRGLRLVSGGTDNHLMLVDLSGEGVTGKEMQQRLDAVGITTNKNGIPFDALKPTVTSGIRLGTPAVTTRGMGEADMDAIADVMASATREYDAKAGELRDRVKGMTESLPLFAW